LGLPRYHDQPALLLLYRTITNYESLERQKQHAGPFEVTQLVNSFLSVLAHPWDQLLDQDALRCMKLTSPTFRECRFPQFANLPTENTTAAPQNLYDLLRVLRHGMAHENIELLGRKELRALRPTGTLPTAKEGEIAGLKIWNQKSETGPPNWCTALDVNELKHCLYAMQRLCEKRHLWKDHVREEHEHRERERRAKRAI
jgi:hypothetical protein